MNQILSKDKSIKSLVEYLYKKYGIDTFKIMDYWAGDNCAIGLTDVSGKYLIYISTYKLKQSGYFVSLENPSNDVEVPYEDAGHFDNLQLAEMEEILVRHLRIEK